MRDEQFLAHSDLYPLSKYVSELRTSLPADAFQPARSRLLFIPAHLAVVVMATIAVAAGWLPWPLVPVASLAIGTSFACLAFVAHEALHGGVVRGKRAKYVVGLIGFFAFMVSPRLWVAWHGRVHHGNTNLPNDPDMYPSLEEYKASRTVRIATDSFSLGGRRWTGVLSLILGFTVQSANQLASAQKVGFLSASQHRRAIAETALAFAVWAGVAAAVGFVPFLFVYVLPLLIGNAIVMAFILTNHSLSPRVSVNDPLVSGLSVTTPAWYEWLTLNFGMHVEHHVFPAMSSRHARAVRDLLQKHWPQRYQSMPLSKALLQLHRTPRVYKDAVTLVDPRTGREFPTLLPG